MSQPTNSRRTRAPTPLSRPDATATLLRRCADLAESGTAAVALATAWQRLAVDTRSQPRTCPIRFPLLEELPTKQALRDECRNVARLWLHLGDHLTRVEELCMSIRDWPSVVKALDARLVHASCRRDTHGAWPDPAGDILQALRPSNARATGAFYTPSEVACLMVSAVGPPTAGDAVIDPSCGTGRLLAAAAASCPGDAWSCGFFGVDLDRDALVIAALNLIAAGAGPHVWLHRGDGLSARFVRPDGSEIAFDRTLGNPPFGTRTRTRTDSLRAPVIVVVDPAARRRPWEGGVRETLPVLHRTGSDSATEA